MTLYLGFTLTQSLGHNDSSDLCLTNTGSSAMNFALKWAALASSIEHLNFLYMARPPFDAQFLESNGSTRINNLQHLHAFLRVVLLNEFVRDDGDRGGWKSLLQSKEFKPDILVLEAEAHKSFCKTDQPDVIGSRLAEESQTCCVF